MIKKDPLNMGNLQHDDKNMTQHKYFHMIIKKLLPDTHETGIRNIFFLYKYVQSKICFINLWLQHLFITLFSLKR